MILLIRRGKAQEPGIAITTASSNHQRTVAPDGSNAFFLQLIKELTGYGTYRYAVSERKASLNVASRLRTIFKEGVISFDLAQNIIVLKTMPGVASAACAAIDGMEITGLVGSLAGDDTAMLVMRTNEDAQEFCNEIHTMLK